MSRPGYGTMCIPHIEQPHYGYFNTDRILLLPRLLTKDPAFTTKNVNNACPRGKSIVVLVFEGVKKICGIGS